MAAFDAESARLRAVSAAGGMARIAGAGSAQQRQQQQQQQGGEEGLDSMLNPSSMPASSAVTQPALFCGSLKGYQLRGLQWLANLYEQGINGILADEMGLGKTIQAIVLLCHLAEEKGIWGPFLVVCPSSTLPNWTEELRRFAPALRFLPYWGSQKEREVLRRSFGAGAKRGLYTKARSSIYIFSPPSFFCAIESAFASASC